MGAYKHDDIWYLKATFVRSLTLMYYEQDSLQQRIYSVKKQLKA